MVLPHPSSPHLYPKVDEPRSHVANASSRPTQTSTPLGQQIYAPHPMQSPHIPHSTLDNSIPHKWQYPIPIILPLPKAEHAIYITNTPQQTPNPPIRISTSDKHRQSSAPTHATPSSTNHWAPQKCHQRQELIMNIHP